ncbi:type II secretion system F family protein [Cryptosporangium sp. NPDC048952]|uniref:type II secretion system F family protein n=1 Tax=Cryptosporangium sp. NPDC048952 TaxID=3363961 RepID=UPI0037215C0E
MSGLPLAVGILLLAATLIALRPTARRRLTRLASAPAPGFWSALSRRRTPPSNSPSHASGPAMGRAGRDGGGLLAGGRDGSDGSGSGLSRAGGGGRWMGWGLPGLVGMAVAVVVGGWWGLGAGVVAGVAVQRVVRRLPSPAVGREREAAAAELPYAVDLLAAVLKSGAPLDRAVALVGAAIGGPLGERLALVGRSLRLGVAGEAGWRALDDVPGADGFVPAAVRAADSGAALAAACGRCAADLREGREARAEAAAHRASVWVVLPLGFCFLPAFVLVGVVPIVLGVLDDLLT